MPCRYVLKQRKSSLDLRIKTKKFGHRNVVIQHPSTLWTDSTCVRKDKTQPASETFVYFIDIMLQGQRVWHSSIIRHQSATWRPYYNRHYPQKCKIKANLTSQLSSRVHRLKICARDNVHNSVSKRCWYIYHLLSAINHTCGIAFKAYAI